MSKIWIALGALIALAVGFWIWHKYFHAMVFFKSLDNLKQEVVFTFLGKDYTLAKGEGIKVKDYTLTANFYNTESSADYYVEVTITKAGKQINKQKYPNYK